MKVGNTPMIKLSDKLYGKLEAVNPGGSIKDRPVKYILDYAENNRLIQKGDTIIEATSGNTGISLSMMCAERGYKCIIVMPSDMSIERKKMLKFFGAELVEVDEGDFDGAIELKEKLAKENGYIELNQFNNKLNIECHYSTTFQEIISSIDEECCGQELSAFVLGTGTGGTLMGLQKGIECRALHTKLVAVEPYESAVMSGGEAGLHGIQGIGDGSKFLVDLNFIDDIKTVKTECAKTIEKHLALRYGLFVGISAGANVFASFQWLRDNNKKNAVTILCDRGERYFSCL